MDCAFDAVAFDAVAFDVCVPDQGGGWLMLQPTSRPIRDFKLRVDEEEYIILSS